MFRFRFVMLLSLLAALTVDKAVGADDWQITSPNFGRYVAVSANVEVDCQLDDDGTNKYQVAMEQYVGNGPIFNPITHQMTIDEIWALEGSISGDTVDETILVNLVPNPQWEIRLPTAVNVYRLALYDRHGGLTLKHKILVLVVPEIPEGANVVINFDFEMPTSFE